MPTHRGFDESRTNKCALALGKHKLGVHAQREQPRGREHLNPLAASDGARRRPCMDGHERGRMPCFRRAGGAEDGDAEARAGQDGSSERQEAGVERDFAAVMA
jgi:hypothetical protein